MRRRSIAAILALTALLATSGGLPALRPATARADGDPASDALLTENAFIPSVESLDAAAPRRLLKVLDAAERAGFRIRVAIIADQGYLGTVTSLWGKPGSYASYLWRELSLDYDGQVLVVMPGGYGLHGPASGASAVTGPEQHVTAPTPVSGNQLIDAAAVAVWRLSAAHGHPLPQSALDVGAAPNVPSSGAAAPWIAFLAGLGVVLAAWGVSLRLRPARPHWPPGTSGPGQGTASA